VYIFIKVIIFSFLFPLRKNYTTLKVYFFVIVSQICLRTCAGFFRQGGEEDAAFCFTKDGAFISPCLSNEPGHGFKTMLFPKLPSIVTEPYESTVAKVPLKGIFS
jgi:hypothetical protein